MLIKTRTLHPSIEILVGALLALLLAWLVLASSTAHAATNELLDQFLAGPMRGVEAVVFAARKLNPTDGHWYANFGYYAADPNRKAYAEGTKLYRLNLKTRQIATLLADAKGGVRDPQVHYDGKKMLFAYRKGGTENYHLYEM